MNRTKTPLAIAIVVLAAVSVRLLPTRAGISAHPAKSDMILKSDDVGTKLFPERVFFRGQVASTQLRNAAGIHFADDAYLLFSLVDNSGYSTEIRQKYQAYVLSEVPLEIQGHALPAGAYGVGFVNGGKFIAMDLGAHDLIVAESSRDTEIKRPVPLQILGDSTTGKYRLYFGRDYAEFRRTGLASAQN